MKLHAQQCCESRIVPGDLRLTESFAARAALLFADATASLYTQRMYAQKLRVDVVIAGERKPCPLDWLDAFSMRNFTNSAEFDDTLPLADGLMEASLRVKPERLAEVLSAWLTQRGKGNGQPVSVEIRPDSR